MRWPWQRQHPVLDPQTAYDLWSADYGEPPNAFQKIEQEHLSAMMPSVGGRRVLDLGCGRGRVLSQLAKRNPEALFGLDLSLGMVAHWLAPGVSRIAADLDRLPFRSARFDLAVAALVLAHLPSLKAALPPILELIRPGGRLLLSDFHPAAAARGWQRTFRISGTRRVRAARHFPHDIEDYRHPFVARGWQLEEMREPEWEGVPVLLLMRWRRPPETEAGTLT